MTRNRGANKRPRNRASAKRARRRARPQRDNLARRVRAGGLGRRDETTQRTIDEYRIAIARRIWMALNRSLRCRMRICKRNRGCMAPGGVCGGYVPTPARGGGDYARLIVQIRETFKAADARRQAAETAATALFEKRSRAKPTPFVPAKAGTQL